MPGVQVKKRAMKGHVNVEKAGVGEQLAVGRLSERAGDATSPQLHVLMERGTTSDTAKAAWLEQAEGLAQHVRMAGLQLRRGAVAALG
jgi:hypothetical protein